MAAHGYGILLPCRIETNGFKVEMFAMTPVQMLRAVWVRRWIVLLVFLVLASAGSWHAWNQPRSYTANALLVLDVRPDPLLGGLGSAASMQTQIEILRTDKVASRVVQSLGLASKPEKVDMWQAATGGKEPLTFFLADLVRRGLSVEVVRGSNIINISYTGEDSTQAIEIANAVAKAATDLAVEMRVGPARESADWMGTQTVALRSSLEQAQAKLSQFQKDNGIVFSDERMSTEVARLAALELQLGQAQADRIEASGRARGAVSATPPNLQNSPFAMNLMSQLAAAESRQAELSLTLGPGHPARVQVEEQVTGLKRQLAAESARLAEGSAVISRVSAQKVGELRAMVESQKSQVLALRTVRDQAAVLVRDVETAQRAYEAASQRVSQLMLESQNNQPTIRLLSAATEATDGSNKRRKLFAMSVMGAAVAAMALAIGLEMLDPRIRAADDLTGIEGLPLLGVIYPMGSKRPVYRRLPIAAPLQRRPLTALPGPRAS